MSRPRVLCVSADRATRASITLSLTDAPIDVVIAQHPAEAVDRLTAESIDAVLIDARTVVDVPAVAETVESEAPGTPTFVHWGDGDDDSVAVLSEVVARSDEHDSTTRLADVVTARLDAEGRSDAATSDHSDQLHPDESPLSAERGDESDTDDVDLESIVDTVRRRLVDVRSPLTVERALREAFTATDRYLFAWVGEYDRGEREIVPWLTASAEMAWPMQRTFGIGGGDHPLLERAVRNRSLQVHQNVPNDPAIVPFGERALAQDVRAVAAAPLATSEELYGVFVVYAFEPFSPAERTTIQSVAETASHVLETIAVHGQLEQRERALQRYERLVETAGDGMYVLDDQGHFMTVNDALVEMTGYSREGLLGEPASILLDETSVDTGRSTIRTLLDDDSEETTDTAEVTVETKTGKTIPCEVQLAILVRDETFHGSVGVVRDITERKQRERKLRERNERLDAFARIVSHDLRNPLSVSQGYLDIVEESESIEHVENVRSGLDRMESIIEDVLAIARSGEWAAETDPINLESVSLDAWEHVSTADASLTVTETITIDADRPRLLRLLENLFRNAIEHGCSGSETDITIRVGPFETEDERGFFVEDDGDGIPEERRDNLFDPSTSSSSSGLGIGLWVVREVAAGHGWSVTAAASEDGGARFEFVFDD
ncbi:PAS domain S-box protein [Natrialbaceae archaeon A-arb3/5]